jgi:hypothetical protein
MKRFSLGAGLAVLATSLFMLVGSGTALAVPSTTCVVKSLPSFMDQGEFGTASTVADIIQVGCNPEFAGQTVKITDQELQSRCRGDISWSLPFPYKPVVGTPTIGKVKLDNHGNATVVVWGGEGCAAGETIVAVHLEAAPYTTVTTPFTIVPGEETPEGVTALPSSLVESDVNSSVATIVQVEFPSVYAEHLVRVSAEQLFARCLIKPHLMWIGPDETVLTPSGESATVKLDNSGNAFVVLLGGGSCASGPSEIEASLLAAPYTTKSTTFTVTSPTLLWK